MSDELDKLDENFGLIPNLEYVANDLPSTDFYVSKPGFEVVPLLRGFDEIRKLWKILEAVKEKAKADIFICGGYARYCASPRNDVVRATDIDIYSETEDAFNLLKATLKEEYSLSVRHQNEVSLTYARKEEGPLAYAPIIQLVKPLKDGAIVAFGDKKTILENFDFTVVRAAILSSEEVLVDADFIHDEKLKLLRLKNIHCPVSSTLRCMKYSKKGYWLRPLECLHLFLDWEKRDDEYKAKLANFITEANKGKGLSQEDVDELEAMMRID